MKAAITRRLLLAGASGLGALPARAADPAALPAQPSLLVAGPAGSPVAQWADVIAPALAQTMMSPEPLDRDTVGGLDGVTGVNHFQAQINPDGSTALLLPGSALLAWLFGDTRVRFDVGAWAPLWGGCTSAVAVARRLPEAGRPVRVGIAAVAGPGLAAALALELMGTKAVAVRTGSADPLRDGEVDVALVRGPLPLAGLADRGWRPWFRLDGARDPGLAGLPLASELFGARRVDPALLAAYRAVAAAAALPVALVAPAVAPAAVLAWWRRGCEGLPDNPAVRDAAEAAGVAQDGSGAIARQLAAIALDTAAMLSLRSLMAERFGLVPG